MPVGVYIRSKEHLNNMSLVRKGKKLSEEHRKKISEALKNSEISKRTQFKKGHKTNLGKRWSTNKPKIKLKKLILTEEELEKRKILNKIKRNAWKNDYSKKENKCYLCGSVERLNFHHTNYKEHKGITLCFNHHNKLHKIKRRFERGIVTN